MSRNSNSRKTTWAGIFADPTHPQHISIARDLLSGLRTMPKTRGDCTHKRTKEKPCPFYKCRHHVALDYTDGYGVVVSGALYHGSTGCILDAIEERAGEETRTPSGACVFTGSEIESFLGIPQRSSYEVLRSMDVKESFEDVHQAFIIGGEVRLNPHLLKREALRQMVLKEVPNHEADVGGYNLG